jgi:hypothetical protein
VAAIHHDRDSIVNLVAPGHGLTEAVAFVGLKAAAKIRRLGDPLGTDAIGRVCCRILEIPSQPAARLNRGGQSVQKGSLFRKNFFQVIVVLPIQQFHLASGHFEEVPQEVPQHRGGLKIDLR